MAVTVLIWLFFRSSSNAQSELVG